MFATVNRFRGQGYKDRLLNLHDEVWDRRLGVRTFGYHPAHGEPGSTDWQVHYTPTPYGDIFRLLRMVDLGRDDVFVDFGCGMGRSVFAASWLGAARAIGVEIVQDLCDKANDNLHRSRLAGRDIQFVCQDAQDFQAADITVCFMFHPFGQGTLAQALRNMELGRAGRQCAPLRIIYVNPVYDFVMQQQPWLECIGRVPATKTWGIRAARYESTLWRSRNR